MCIAQPARHPLVMKSWSGRGADLRGDVARGIVQPRGDRIVVAKEDIAARRALHGAPVGGGAGDVRATEGGELSDARLLIMAPLWVNRAEMRRRGAYAPLIVT